MYAWNLKVKFAKLFAVAVSFCIIICIASMCVAQESPTNVLAVGYSGPFVLVNFDQPDSSDVQHWRLYYATPFDPENWIWYKSQEGLNGLRYHHWQVTNEIGSAHRFTIHIPTIPSGMIGVISIGVAAVDAAGNVSGIGVATWYGITPQPDKPKPQPGEGNG